MGLLSQTMLHNLTDRMAARVQANLNGVLAERTIAANPSLADTVDGSGDHDLEAALLAKALVVDRGAMPGNLKTALSQLLGQTRYAEFAGALSSYVQSAPGGAHASLAAYVSAVSGKVHPLAAEVWRNLSPGADPFALSGAVVGVFAPTYAATAPMRVYTGADGSLVDDTVDAADVGTADVALFAADDHALYVGADAPFTGLVAALSTAASADCALTFQYWNGSAWATLTVVDHSVGMTRNGPITWAAPADWAMGIADAGGTAFTDKTPRYWVRLARTADTVATPPVASCLTIIPSAVLNASGGHLGVPQPPLAIVEIKADGTLLVTPIVAPDATRFELPGDGADVSLVRLRALTALGGNITPTVSYTDQGGAASTQAQAQWESPAALSTVNVSLGSDTGLAAVLSTGWTATTALTEGVFAVEVAELRTPAI